MLASGRFILGDEVATFEAATAAYLGSGHSLGTSSGSDSLLACLMALDLEPDDEVLCPAFTFVATASGISRAGAKPVFADVSPLTLDCRREDLESRITPHTRAIVAVHLFGRCSELDPIVGLANDHGLVLIEDTAQALGASEWRPKGRHTRRRRLLLVLPDQEPRRLWGRRPDLHRPRRLGEPASDLSATTGRLDATFMARSAGTSDSMPCKRRFSQ